MAQIKYQNDKHIWVKDIFGAVWKFDKKDPATQEWLSTPNSKTWYSCCANKITKPCWAKLIKKLEQDLLS